ncbi:hypothetical protein BS47DRAFT_1350828 [Hydnum rufescens UP504]|uniref:Uncharacterized protein n=1 Tax=Hydnum rufescens UP504 TaxID=1448309 RepID=A0A9P6ALE6_9AGAM|nr:hypothetical protein BS47DRAFT_1350828 [Hydnum rufescens UP504]
MVFFSPFVSRSYVCCAVLLLLLFVYQTWRLVWAGVTALPPFMWLFSITVMGHDSPTSLGD